MSEGSLFRTHVHEPDHILTFAERSSKQTDLVATPVQFHQRNLTHRLAARNQPRSSIRFISPSEIARDVVQGANGETESLDRIDRVRSLETLVETEPASFDAFRSIYGSRLSPHVTDIEATRRAVGAVTAYDDERLTAFRGLLHDLPAFVSRDGTDRIEGAIATQRRLSEVSEFAVSNDAALRRASEMIHDVGADVWNDEYEDVERIHLAGVSSIEASLLDLLTAIATETTVDIHLFLRAGTGPRIDSRLRGQPRSSTPNFRSASLETEAIELVTTTRNEEARLALAMVNRLLAANVSLSDILLVARDVDTYEDEIRRAARQHGQSVSVWTQLVVTETVPYALVHSLCSLLDRKTGRISVESLFQPLVYGWVPPDTTDWGLRPQTLVSLRKELREYSPRSPGEWRNALTGVDVHQEGVCAVESLLDWVVDRPQSPTPVAVRETLDPLIDRFRQTVLPTYRDRDTDTLSKTTETARSLVRLETMIEEVATKYEAWLGRDQTDRSWEEVQYLFETIATVKPGRREHANAAVLDVVDATDTWLRRVPYVIALGLADGEWPQTADGLFPVEVQDEILAGQSESVRSLAPLERWTEAREYDHFADAVSTATEQLFCTRHLRDAGGAEVARSPFLDTLETTHVEAEVTRRFLSTQQTIPPALAAVFEEVKR